MGNVYCSKSHLCSATPHLPVVCLEAWLLVDSSLASPPIKVRRYKYWHCIIFLCIVQIWCKFVCIPKNNFWSVDIKIQVSFQQCSQRFYPAVCAINIEILFENHHIENKATEEILLYISAENTFLTSQSRFCWEECKIDLLNIIPQKMAPQKMVQMRHLSHGVTCGGVSRGGS